VLALGGVGGLRVRGAQRGRGHHFTVEAAREGAREHIRRVVGATIEVAGQHPFDQHRIGQGAVGREPDHMIGRMRIERVDEPMQHVGF
jgi:hypothetical protein